MTFSERMQELMTKGVEASRDIIAKAGTQAHTWGEMGVLKVEILQLRSQAEKLTTKLGAEIYAAFGEKGQTTISADSPSVKELIVRIGDLDKEIEDREKRYAALGGSEAELHG